MKEILFFYRYPILDLKPSDMQNWLWYDFSWNVFIHNANDFPDALTIHPWIKNLPPQTKSEYLLRTKHFSKENVKSKPCSEYQPNSCKDVFLQRSILEKYGCRIAIFYTGKTKYCRKLPFHVGITKFLQEFWFSYIEIRYFSQEKPIPVVW